MSGALEPDYLLVKDPLPLDGWGERAFRIGEDNPIILPSLQVDPMSGNIHCRGSRPEDVGQLVELIKSFARRAPKPGGLIGELSCDFVEAPFETDPTFWPRMYLDLRGSIRIRARNSAEAIKAVTAIVALATSGALDERRAWVGGQIRAGVEHKLRLTTVSSDELRLAAKVAYGLAFLSSATAQACADPWRSVREYVLTGQGPAPVAAVSRPGTSTHWPDRHVAAVLEMGERLAGVVWLYGGQWTVDLGEASLAGPFIGRLPIVAMSLRDGTKTGWVRDPGIAADMVSLLQGGAS